MMFEDATTKQQRRKMAVELGGSDQIIPTEAIRRYLTNEDTWKTRWVGRVVDGTGEEEDGAEGNCMTRNWTMPRYSMINKI
jgi:hypothetical protein